MSQNSITIANGTGLQVRTGFNNSNDTLATKFSGSSAPSTPVTYQSWVDTSVSPVLLKMYDGADWITTASLDAATNSWIPYRSGSALGTMSTQSNTNVNIDGGAIDGTPIGGTTASTGLFTTLNATGVATFDSTVSAASGVYVGGTVAANLLDDYEEGTFTPGVSFGFGTTGITYTEQSGEYTKVGNLVTAVVYIALSSKGTDTGIFRVTGFPFTAKNNALGCHTQPYMTGPTTSANLSTYVDPNSASSFFVKYDGGLAATLLTDADITDTSYIRATYLYHTV